MKVNFFAVCISAFVSSFCWSNTAENIPSLQEISHIAQSAIRNKMEVPQNAKVKIVTQTLDKRFKRPSCVSPLTATLVSKTIKRNNTIKLSCKTKGSYPWQVYISVAVQIQYQVAVATKTLSNGELIDKNKVMFKYVDENAVRGTHFDSISKIVGTKAKKRIAKGYPIFKQNICFVCKGDIIKIIAKTKSLSIRTNGTALIDGNMHDTIEVKNTNSNKIIKAEVIGIGEVQVKM